MCKYCSGADNEKVADIDTGWSYCEVSINGSTMQICAGRYNEGDDFEINIGFCPMCGRMLASG